MEEKIEENRIESKKDPEKAKKTKKKNIFVRILNIFAVLLLLFVIGESVIGFMGFDAIKNDKEPKYLRNTTTSYVGNDTITTYDFGLYKVIKTDNSKEYSTKLVPFFLN